MELKEGMFVRTKKGTIYDCYVSEQMGKPIYYPKTSETNGYIDWNEVYKKSKNIIDILEVGDYVNGVQVIDKEIDNVNEKYLQCGVGDYVICIYNSNEIEDIVTKEQFKAMEYRLGDK